MFNGAVDHLGERRDTKRSGCEKELVHFALKPFSFPDNDILALLATFAGGGEDSVFIFTTKEWVKLPLLLFRLFTGNSAKGSFPGDVLRVN